MKKLLKFILPILIIGAVLFTVTGCGKEDNEETDSKKAVTQEKTSDKTTEETEQNGKSKSYNAFSKIADDFVISAEIIGEDSEDNAFTLAKKGNNVYIDTTSDGEHISIIVKDNTTYMISHDDKKYIEIPGQDIEELGFDEMNIMTKEDLADIEKADYTTGKETIDGVEYDYEEYKGDIQEKFYFLGNEIKYIKDLTGEKTFMKINKASNVVSDSLFEIPAGYEEMDLGA